MALSIDAVYRDFNTQAVPASGDYEPRKPEIRALLKQIQNSGGQSVTRNTFAALSGVTPPNENYMGIVLDDPDATKNGYYARSGAAWVWGRGFPDTFAKLTVSGGTANNVQASVESGVSPANSDVFFIVPTGTNTGAVTLSISGGTAKSVLRVDGAALTAGEWPAGRVLLLADFGAAYRLLSDPAVDALLQQAIDALADATQLTTPGDDTVSRAKLRSDIAPAVPVTPLEYDAVGDGDADDTAELAAMVAAGHPIFLPEGREFKTTNLLWNIKGLPISGPGSVVLPTQVDAGPVIMNRKINTDIWDGKDYAGRQYLFLFHNRLINRQHSNIVMSGDSTTYGVDTIVDDANFTPTGLLTKLAQRKGFGRIAMYNRGFGGKTTRQWVDDYIAGDMALDPDLYIVRWGINDPINDRTPAQTIADLREGLLAVRTSPNGATGACAVVVMMPNALSYVKEGADEAWLDAIRDGVRQAALDFKCFFVDTAALAGDAYYGSGQYMDDLGYYAGVHPKDVMNVWLYSGLADELWPTGLLHFSDTASVNQTALQGKKPYADLPSTYPFGESTFAGDAAGGWPANVIIHTDRQSDGPCTQWVTGYESSLYMWARVSRNDTDVWHPIQLMMPLETPITSKAAGFTAAPSAGQEPTASRTGDRVTLRGWLAMNAPGTIANTTLMATLPANYRPKATTLTSIVVSNGSGSHQVVPITIGTNGQITCGITTTVAGSVIDLTCSFVAPALVF